MIKSYYYKITIFVRDSKDRIGIINFNFKFKYKKKYVYFK